jgi:hypothetical protein
VGGGSLALWGDTITSLYAGSSLLAHSIGTVSLGADGLAVLGSTSSDVSIVAAAGNVLVAAAGMVSLRSSPASSGVIVAESASSSLYTTVDTAVTAGGDVSLHAGGNVLTWAGASGSTASIYADAVVLASNVGTSLSGASIGLLADSYALVESTTVSLVGNTALNAFAGYGVSLLSGMSAAFESDGDVYIQAFGTAGGSRPTTGFVSVHGSTSVTVFSGGPLQLEATYASLYGSNSIVMQVDQSNGVLSLASAGTARVVSTDELLLKSTGATASVYGATGGFVAAAASGPAALAALAAGGDPAGVLSLTGTGALAVLTSRGALRLIGARRS